CFITEKDAPWLVPLYEKHDHFETWLYWVYRCFSKTQLTALTEFLENSHGSAAYCFENVKHFNFHFTHFADAKEWFSLPKRSIIWIDECQQFFPPRPVSAGKPDYIAEFETHRHKGFDVHLVTQDPKLIDVNVRRLTGRHVHYHNPFGGERVTRFESSKAIDPDNYHDIKQCQKSFIKRNKNYYGVYWSAEIHTHKFKIPKIFIIGMLIVLFLGFIGYRLYNSLLKPTEPPPQVESVTTNSLEAPRADSVPFESEVKGHLAQMMSDVYIDGSVIRYLDGEETYYYSFSESETGKIFYPDLAGLEVVPIDKCLARVVFDGFDMVVTCNPFYTRPEYQEQKSNLFDSVVQIDS
ncbi:zonular occludens toxin domain-containing protein, partial [Thaumasiovibrio sp. DFM-14]|uniref:zonular occludens toxin domain-containing protein n=1 Tax=Thaumasiovibrio sp. DFM-14 TaxID=3384792 RepID=UPI0039A27E08